MATAFDIQNLNNAISGVGQAFEQRHKDAIEQSIRQRMLDMEMRRMTAEEGRQATAAGGHVNVWLGTEDANGEGGAMNYVGPAQGLDAIIQKSQDAGKPLKRINKPTTPAPFAEVTKELPGGTTIRFHTRSQDEANNVLASVGKMPQVPKTTGKTSTVQENEAADKEDEIQAKLQAHLKALAESDASAGGVTGSDRGETIAGINAAIAQSQARKAHVLRQDVPMEVGSEPAPLGADARPGAKAGTRKVFAPRGQVLNPPTAAAPAGATKKPTRAMARDYVKKYGAKATEQLQSDGYDTSGYAD